MNRTGTALLVLVSSGLAGCSALTPYSTYPQQPVAGKKDAGPRVAICYDALASSRYRARMIEVMARRLLVRLGAAT